MFSFGFVTNFFTQEISFYVLTKRKALPLKQIILFFTYIERDFFVLVCKQEIKSRTQKDCLIVLQGPKREDKKRCLQFSCFKKMFCGKKLGGGGGGRL